MKLYFLSIFLLFYLNSNGSYWTPKTDFGGGSRLDAVSFSINGFGYVGTGMDTVANQYIYKNDFWKYNPITDSWTQIANVGANGVYGMVGFSIGNYGYIGLGNSTNFWKYNPVANVWSPIAPYPGTLPRIRASAVTINNRAYVGLGGGLISGVVYNDWYEYNPTTNSWLTKAVFPGAARKGACEFSVNGNAYIGGGSFNSSLHYMDYYKYDPTLNTWNSIGNFPAGVHAFSTSFSIGNNGFILIGWTANSNSQNELWKFDPFGNSWTPSDSFPGTIRNFSTSFTIGSMAYVCTGDHPYAGFTYPLDDLWEYTADSTTYIQESAESNLNVSVYPNPVVSYLEVEANSIEESAFLLYDSKSRKRVHQIFHHSLRLNTEHLTSGIYFYEVRNSKLVYATGKLIKM